MRESYKKLRVALDDVEYARSCIAQNRGPDKEEAREAYEHAINEELIPAFRAALEDATGDLDARTIERIAQSLMKTIEKQEQS